MKTRRGSLSHPKGWGKGQVYLKLENLQPTRAFKVRGGLYYALVRKDEAQKRA